MEAINSIVELLKGSAGGIAVALFFFRFLYSKLKECEARHIQATEDCAKQHNKLTRALIAVTASDAKISVDAIQKMLE